MNQLTTCRLVIALLVIAWLLGSTDIRAQSRDDSQKRLFAARLTRGARISATSPTRSVSAHAALRKVEASRPASFANDISSASAARLALAARAAPSATGQSLGIPMATPCVPSAHGSGRDAYVEALYPQILGRKATQCEVDYWARVLASGVRADVVAELVWKSREHRSLVRSGEAPNIPLGRAYRTAYAAGLANRKERIAAE